MKVELIMNNSKLICDTEINTSDLNTKKAFFRCCESKESIIIYIDNLKNDNTSIIKKKAYEPCYMIKVTKDYFLPAILLKFLCIISKIKLIVRIQ
jgi:hypothetical protein